MEFEPSPTPGSGTCDKPQSRHDTVVPDTISSPTGTTTCSSRDEPRSADFEVEPHTSSSPSPRLSSLTSAGSNGQQHESSVPVKGQCHSQTLKSSPAVKSENGPTTSRELTLYASEPNLAVDIVNSRSNVRADVGHDELQQRQGPDSSLQAVQSDHKDTGPWRSSEDGYNWRKYGQKHIKGSEFPRSYYKCSHPSCQVKKQVERSHNGCITEVVYKGQHDHPKPQSNNQIVACTIRSIQEERSNGVSVSNSTEEKSLNGHGQTSPQPKPNGAPELSLVLVSDCNVEGAGEKSIRVRDAVEDDDDPESKRRRLKLNTDTPTKGQQHESLVQPDQCQSQAIASSCSVENMNAAVSSHDLALSVTVPNPSVDVFTSGAIVPSAVDCDDRGQKSDSGVHKVPSDHKGTTRFVTAERLWGDGYNWRKYGQKQIKGSEFPRSYYRCTYPNCQVKKQLERSHDGKVTEIIYKGEHDHPKPQPSSHMAVGRILSIQEDGCDRLSSLSCTEDKSSDGHNKLTHHTELGVPELSPTVTRDNGVQGEEGSQSNRIDDKVEHDDDLEFNRRRINVNEASIDAAAASNDKQGKVSIEVNGQCQSQILASSPSAKDKTTDVSTHELTPSTPASNPPVYMVTSRGIVPVEVDCDESRQRQVSDSGVQATQSDHNGISIAMTEKLLENAYHWRKYGQKNIKGSEFPRSYYRCTHPNCTVKMQLERSHDGRIIEIIYKGKHDHPKPQPISRMAIGAILSLEEERSDMFSLNSREEEKRSNGHAQTSLDANPNGTSELSPASDDDVEYAGGKLHRTHDEVENDNDAEFKHRKKDAGDVDFTPVVRAPKEPRIVVETLTEFDVVDDGYRWQKYGRKMVKGNPNPRNYYRCSNAACPVKKHVERASHNPKAVITTYEGKHNHDLPPPRTSGMDIVQRFGSSDTVVTRLDDNDTISLDVGIATTSGPENRSNEKQESMDVEPIQSKATETNTVSAHNGDATDTADHDRSRKDRGESFSFDTPSLKDSSDQGAQNMES